MPDFDFIPMNTSDHTTQYRKVLLYAHHGWGKTTQAKYYQQKYGNGLILSGESGLSSIRTAGIDYFPFQSWDGKVDPANNVFSFRALLLWMQSPAFKAKGYKWVMVDSLTELSDHAFRHADDAATALAAKIGKPTNGFAVWEEYGGAMIGACKYIRDMPMHVIVTSLAKEGEDENGNKEFWPMVKGKQVQTQLPGIFDCVLCGIKRSAADIDNTTGEVRGMRTTHYIVTDETKGWHGKVRDEKRRLSPVEKESDITKLFDRMEMPDSEYEVWLNNKQQGEKK